MNQDVSDSLFKSDGGGNKRYPNPFFGVPLQYLPINSDGQLWWADQFMLRFDFLKPAFQKIANYFITQLNIESDDEETVKEYKNAFEELNWVGILQTAGLNLLGYSNTFVSINQGFDRFLKCKACNNFTKIDAFDDFDFDKGVYKATCRKCKSKGVHALVDKPVTDTKKINITFWPPREIKLQHDEVTGSSEYYWDVPPAYKQKITKKGNKFFPKIVPAVVYEAIFKNKMIKFNEKNFIHLKMPTPASLKTDGKSVPLTMYLFDSFFILKVLERYNEVICYEDINPFRVISMSGPSSPANPIFSNMDGGVWSAAIDNMIEQHRRDPGGYHKFPFTFEFQHLGGDARQLAPTELIQHVKYSILNALNVPREFYEMTLQTQAVGPALRLFENSWNCIIDHYNELLQHMANVISRIKGLPQIKIKLQSITHADDIERKSIIGQLVSSNSIARSELLSLFGYDYRDQLRKKMEEETIAAEIQEEEQKKQEISRSSKKSIFGDPSQQQGGGMPVGGNPNDILQQAEEIAQNLQPLSGPERRQELQQIKAHNETLWHSVKGRLEQMDSAVKSDALKQSKSQG